MKNQYLCDVGDYGKYGLLRFLALRGIRLGVNWYLTENDGSSDGDINGYLKKREQYRDFDPDVYDVLCSIVERYRKEDRKVQMIQEQALIPDAVFFDEKLKAPADVLTERAWNRYAWFSRSRSALSGADLVFADPDNGITYRLTSRMKGAEKFILPEEVAKYYYDGQNVVFYCHRGRRSDAAWEKAILQILEYICDAKLFVLTFHRGTQRSYIFVVHPEQAEQYDSLLAEFVNATQWGKDETFTRDDVKKPEIFGNTVIYKQSAVLKYFQKAFPSKLDKETALAKMTYEQINELVTIASSPQEACYYASYLKSGFSGPTIGTVHPKGTKIIKLPDGRIRLVPPKETEHK